MQIATFVITKNENNAIQANVTFDAPDLEFAKAISGLEKHRDKELDVLEVHDTGYKMAHTCTLQEFKERLFASLEAEAGEFITIIRDEENLLHFEMKFHEDMRDGIVMAAKMIEEANGDMEAFGRRLMNVDID